MKLQINVARLVMCLVAALGSGFAAAQPAVAGHGLPPTLVWSAYDVASGGYNQAIAIGNALRQRYGVNLRVLPGKDDVSRMLPVRDSQAQFSANGVAASYLAQEGVFEFGVKAWGPQPIRGLMMNNSEQLLTIVAARDSGIRSAADLKGKRVAWVAGSPSLNQNVSAILAFANLTWADVRKVEFGSFGAAMDGLINGQADVAFASSISGKTYQLAKSPRGLVYPVISQKDKAGWARLNAIAPFFFPLMGSEGAELDKDNKVESASYPYPVLVTYEKQDAATVFSMTRAMVEAFPDYKDAAPGNSGWAIERQQFAWVIPFHEGAIRFWKERGVWKPEHQAHNDRLIARQKVLADAWKAVVAANLPDDRFERAWMAARADALRKAGFEPGVSSW